MNAFNLVLAMRGLRGRKRAVLVAIFVIVAVALIYGFAVLRTDDSRFGAWWPHAGLAVVAAITATKRYRWLVLGIDALILISVLVLAGLPLPAAFASGLLVTLEVWVVAKFIVGPDDLPRLVTVPDAIRFLVGVVTAAGGLGLIAGALVLIFRDDGFLVAALTVAVAQASAIVVIVPIVLVTQVPVPRGESLKRAVNALMLLASVALAFAPGQLGPMSFLPIPFLAWAASSLTMSFVLLEVIGTTILAFALTTLGGGPFTEAALGEVPPTVLFGLYIVVVSVSVLLVAAARNERQQTEQQREAAATLLHRGFELSSNGFAMIHAERGVFTVLEANSAAPALLPSSLRSAGDECVVVDGSRMHGLLGRMIADQVKEMIVAGDEELPVEVTVTALTSANFDHILLLSIVDLRQLRRAVDAANRQLDRERAVVEELRALNQRQDDFVSSVSHELRTPITAIVGFAEELESTDLDETQTEYVAIVRRNARRLVNVVEDVLTFSRRAPGTVEAAPPGPVDVSGVIAGVLDDLRHAVREKQIELVMHLPEQPLVITAPADYLARVMINLVTNAVKFTPGGGRIEVAASIRGEVIEITVSDNGSGVEPKDLARVYDRFYRASRASHDGVPGTGLGLSIVKDLVEEMAGSVALESDGRSGTTARLTLPAAVAPALQ